MTTFNKMCSLVCASTITILGVTIPLMAVAWHLINSGALPNIFPVRYAAIVSIAAVSCFWCKIFEGLSITIAEITKEA